MSKKKDIRVPPEFFKTQSLEASMRMFQTGTIDGMEMVRLWKMLGRKDKCPASMALMINKDDLLRNFPLNPPKVKK